LKNLNPFCLAWWFANHFESLYALMCEWVRDHLGCRVSRP